MRNKRRRLGGNAQHGRSLVGRAYRRVAQPNGHAHGPRKTWTAHRVGSVRRVRAIHAYRSAEKDGEWLTMTEAAKLLSVTHHEIRRLIKTGVLPTVQVVAGAPHQIRADDLTSEPVKTAMARKGRPCRVVDADTLPMFTDT